MNNDLQTNLGYFKMIKRPITRAKKRQKKKRATDFKELKRGQGEKMIVGVGVPGVTGTLR